MSRQSDEILRQFESGLEKLRIEVLKNIDSIDLLDQQQVHSLIERLNQRLVVAQHDFLDFVSRVSGGTTSSVERPSLRASRTTKIPEAAAGVLGASAGAILVNAVTLTTPGLLWGATTTTIAGTAAAAIGVSTAVVTLGAGVVVGLAAGGAIYAARLKSRRQKIRKGILRSFDEEAVPKLREWAMNTIARMADTPGGSS